jgi:dipeptidyl-peptidase-4
MAHAAGLRDRHLMLVHGLIDENVHFRHSARLIDALIRERIPYELFLLPGERHSPRAEADRVYLEERILDFFRRTLGA